MEDQGIRKVMDDWGLQMLPEEAGLRVHMEDAHMKAMKGRVARYIPHGTVRKLQAQHQEVNKGTPIENQVSHIHGHMELYERGAEGEFVHPGPDHRDYLDPTPNQANKRKWNKQARTRRNWHSVA